MNRLNCLETNSFPATSEDLNFLQEISKAVATLSALAGADYILSGCEKNGSKYNPGYVVFSGEILPFIGGDGSNNVYIKERFESLLYEGIRYNKRIIREVVFGSATGSKPWSMFQKVSLPLLLEELDNHRKNKNNPHDLTASQIDAYSIDQIDKLLDTKADNRHSHSATQVGAYTKTETDQLLNTKSSTSHTHTPSSVGLDKVDNEKQATKSDFDKGRTSAKQLAFNYCIQDTLTADIFDSSNVFEIICTISWIQYRLKYEQIASWRKKVFLKFTVDCSTFQFGNFVEDMTFSSQNCIGTKKGTDFEITNIKAGNLLIINIERINDTCYAHLELLESCQLPKVKQI